MEREYWRKAQEGFAVENYPNVESVGFPAEVWVAYAVCTHECGNKQFIIDGSTQICDCCGRVMFRTLVRRYSIAQDEDRVTDDDGRTADTV